MIRAALLVIGILLIAPSADAQVFRPRSKTGATPVARKLTLPGTATTPGSTTSPMTAVVTNPLAPTKTPPRVTPTAKTAATSTKKAPKGKARSTKKSGDDDEEVVVVDDDDDE